MDDSIEQVCVFELKMYLFENKSDLRRYYSVLTYEKIISSMNHI